MSEKEDLVKSEAIEVKVAEESIKSKLVAIGNDGSGKTSLLTVLGKDAFSEVHTPTVLGGCVTDVHVDGEHIELALVDSESSKEMERLRPLVYPETNVFLICFAIDSPESLRSVKEKWIPEVQHHSLGVSVIFVGCKKDLRHSEKPIKGLQKMGQKLVSPEEGQQLCKYIVASQYLECSAKTTEGIGEVLEHAARASLISHRPRCGRPGCHVL